MKRRRKLKLNKRLAAALAVLLAVGFAYISSAVNIGGVFTLFKSTWDIHFDNLQVTSGSVSANPPSFNSNNPELTLAVQFTNPGDFYEFTIDAVNAGDIDGMLDTFSDLGITPEQEAYLNYSVTYEDGEALAQYQELNAGDTCTFKIRIEFRDDIPAQDLPQGGASLNLGFDVSYVRADNNRIRRRAENTLYNVLKNEAESNGLAIKYTGNHQDSMDASLSTKDIYHWYADNDTDGTAVTNKNNVIFANHCWQLIRTTDTGGAKLLYNGEVENNQCLNTRGTHVGYSKANDQALSNTYYYGTSYNYDKTSAKFSLSGNVTTGEIRTGEYTCKAMTADSTCEELYYVDNLVNGSTYNVIPLNSNSNYSQFGTLQFNKEYNSLSYFGYMYNTTYQISDKYMIETDFILSNYSLSNSYYYADDISWDGNKYYLVNGYQVSDYSNLVGKYTLNLNNATSGQNVAYYIAAVDGSNMYCIILKSGSSIDDNNYQYTYGNSYTDNNNGTYTINNPNTFNRVDWYSQYSNLSNGKYICINAINNTCSELRKIYRSRNYYMEYLTTNNTFKYSKGFTYDLNTGIYSLSGDYVYIWELDDILYINDNFRNAHYTCWNSSGECSTISYIPYKAASISPYYIDINNGKGVEDAVNEMLYNDNVNLKNSMIKSGLDSWFKQYMIDYSDYLEDTIFCNDRSQSNADSNGWNPNGGSTSTEINFNYYKDLNCVNDTDRFSIANNKAKLLYKVGLLTYKEINLLNNSKARITGNYYWLISPVRYNYFRDKTSVSVVTHLGNTDNYPVYKDLGVRPAISLSPKTFYTSGDGSKETPYIIETN